MAKKQTRRSISVSGETYNAVRDYCDEHGLSASGLVTDLLDRYLSDNAAGPPPKPAEPLEKAPKEEPKAEPVAKQQAAQLLAPIQIQPPQAAGDVKYPDRRGPGFMALPEGATMALWRVTAHLEISRKRQIDAVSSVETLLQNLIHRRMVNAITIVDTEQLAED